MIRTGWRGRSEAKEVFSYQFTVHSLGSRENTTQEYGREGGAEDYTWRKWPDGPLTRQVEQGDQGMKLVFVCGLSVVLAHSFLQEPQKPAEEKPAAATEAKPVASAAKLVNPTKATAESIALGKKAYGTDWAMCHCKWEGTNERGRGADEARTDVGCGELCAVAREEVVLSYKLSAISSRIKK